MILTSEAVVHGFSYGEVFWKNLEHVCGVASVPKCDFNKVAMHLSRGNTLTWVFSCELLHILRPLFCRSPYWGMILQRHYCFSLSIFKKKFTCCHHCFAHVSQIFSILQLLLIICKSSHICMNCVHNLERRFFDN